MGGRVARRTALAGALLLALTGCGTDADPSAGMTRSASPTAVAPTPSPSAPAPSTVSTLPTPSITVPPELQQAGPGVPIEGGDISWPQCPKGMGIPEKPSQGAPLPVDAARYVILGLTNGPGFTPNPCLADQVAFVKGRRLMAAAYSVLSFPDEATLADAGSRGPYDAGTRLGRLGNVGYQQAAYNVATMEAAGLTTPIIWLDVEPVPKFDWSPDLSANAAVVRGAARGYTDVGFSIGAYSTQSLWQRVVGDLRLGVPEWRAAGQTSRAEALRRCGPDRMFQGGSAVLSQWVEDGRDKNVTCPGTSAHMVAWFHQY